MMTNQRTIQRQSKQRMMTRILVVNRRRLVAKKGRLVVSGRTLVAKGIRLVAKARAQHGLVTQR